MRFCLLAAADRAAARFCPVCAVPAPGYRDFGRTGYEGVARNVGNNGYSWSSSVSGSNGFYLNFNTTNLNPSNANNRGHGFQVRCLQHLSTASPRGSFPVRCGIRTVSVRIPQRQGIPTPYPDERTVPFARVAYREGIVREEGLLFRAELFLGDRLLPLHGGQNVAEVVVAVSVEPIGVYFSHFRVESGDGLCVGIFPVCRCHG